MFCCFRELPTFVTRKNKTAANKLLAAGPLKTDFVLTTLVYCTPHRRPRPPMCSQPTNNSWQIRQPESGELS